MNSEKQGTPEGGSSPRRRRTKATDRAGKESGNRERGKVSFVKVDIARLVYEIGELKTSAKLSPLEKWVKDLAKCLVLRNPDLNAYGAALLAEAQSFRERDRTRKKEQKKK